MNFNAIGVVLKECDLMRQASLRVTDKDNPTASLECRCTKQNNSQNVRHHTDINWSFRYHTLALRQECVLHSKSFRKMNPLNEVQSRGEVNTLVDNYWFG
jgi:hypothetical protein